MSDAPNVRNVNPDKPDKAPDMTHGASGQAHSSGATRRLTVVQRRHLVELADIRDEGNTGEAYFYPTGSQYRTAHTLMRLGFLRSADSAIRVYRLTDAGYEEARRGT